MQFQEISIPTPGKVTRGSKGKLGFKNQEFYGKYETKVEFLGEWRVQT